MAASSIRMSIGSETKNQALRAATHSVTSDSLPDYSEPPPGGASLPTSSAILSQTTEFIDLAETFFEGDEYEDLPTTKMWLHCFAGGLAGISEHCLMYPVDLLKTRMMMLNSNYTSMRNAVYHTVKYEGARRLFRGVGVVFVGSGPAHAFYFASYEGLKKQTTSYFGQSNPVSHILAGGGASLVHDFCMTPVDAIKQRLQKNNSAYRNTVQCARSMFRSEGIGSFYRSYGTQICMNVPQQCTQFAIYEFLKKRYNPNNEYRPSIHAVCGGLAGGTAAWLTTPFDVCKTLLNTQPTAHDGNKKIIRGVMNAAKTIYQTSGFTGLYKGAIPRTIHVMPSTAICWSVYEGFKYSLPRLGVGF